MTEQNDANDRDALLHHVEPSSDIRQLASFLRQLYVALRNHGFNDVQALVIVGQAITNVTADEPDVENDDER